MPHSLAVIVARLPVFGFAADGVDDVTTKEEKDVEQAQHDGHAGRSTADDELLEVEHSVQKCQPLHFDGQDHEQEHLFIGIHRCKSEEEGEVEERVARVAGDHGGDDRGDHADQIVQVEFDFAPSVLKPCADHVVEVQREENEQRGRVGRREHECHKAPDLSVHQAIAGQRHHGIQAHTQRRPNEHQQVDGGLAEYDVFHQIADGIPAQLAFQIKADRIIFQV